MIFFFKKKIVNVDCFISNSFDQVNDLAPISKASKFIPDWFKNLPSINDAYYLKRPIFPGPINNVRSCVGIMNSLTKGFILPLWSDLRIDWDQNGFQALFADRISSLIEHPGSQMQGFADNYWILKIESPWILRFSEPLSVASLPPFYHLGVDYPITFAQGINTTVTKYNTMSTHVFILLKKEEVFKNLIIPFNTPIAHYLPITEKSINIKTHIVDQNEWSKIHSTYSPNYYFTRKGIMQRMLNKKLKEKNKCPFSSLWR